MCLHPGKVSELLAELHEGVCDGTPSHDTGVLEAEDAKRRCRICAKMRIVSKACPFDSLVGKAPKFR